MGVERPAPRKVRGAGHFCLVYGKNIQAKLILREPKDKQENTAGRKLKEFCNSCNTNGTQNEISAE